MGCLLKVQTEMDICLWAVERYLDLRQNVMAILVEIIFKAMRMDGIKRNERRNEKGEGKEREGRGSR